MRASRVRSAAFVAARRSFTTYNTNHCCECHAAAAAPEVLGLPPQPGSAGPPQL
jgi:hypothetical protein